MIMLLRLYFLSVDYKRGKTGRITPIRSRTVIGFRGSRSKVCSRTVVMRVVGRFRLPGGAIMASRSISTVLLEDISKKSNVCNNSMIDV